MKFRSFTHFSFARLLILTNIVFWLAFGGLFLAKSYPYKPHKLVFEERAPDLIYFGRAFSYLENERMRPTIRILRLVQWPSFYVASPFNFYFSSRGVVGDTLYHGISFSGYYLILVFMVSFLQWYVVGWLIDWVRNRTKVGPTPARNDRGQAYGVEG